MALIQSPMRPLVSILIPCYNAERWLAQAIQSALVQTWNNIEVIVVDDGSTDKSLEIARSFESPKLEVISQFNRGASAARNRALHVAQGEFIQYLDADDFLSPNKVEAQLMLLRLQPADTIAICNTMHFWEGENPEQGILETGGHFFADSDRPVEWLTRLLGGEGQGARVHPAAWMIPRSVAEAAGDWDEQLSLDDDGEYFTRIVLASSGIRYTPIGHSYYRKFKTGNSLSGATTIQHQWSAMRSLDSKARHLLSRTDSDAAKRAIARCYMERAVQAYPYHPLVTDVALHRIKALKMKPELPNCGSWRGEALRILVGWRAAKLLSLTYHNRQVSPAL